MIKMQIKNKKRMIIRKGKKHQVSFKKWDLTNMNNNIKDKYLLFFYLKGNFYHTNQTLLKNHTNKHKYLIIKSNILRKQIYLNHLNHRKKPKLKRLNLIVKSIYFLILLRKRKVKEILD